MSASLSASLSEIKPKSRKQTKTPAKNKGLQSQALESESLESDPTQQDDDDDDLVIEARPRQQEVELTSKAEVLEAWSQFKSRVEQWEDSKGPMVRWKHGTVLSMEPLEDAIGELVVMVNHCDFHRDSWETVIAIDKFIDGCMKWAERAKLDPLHTNPNGGNEVWSNYADVDTAAAENLSSTIEPIEQLINMRPPLTHQQIARMYGWVDPLGNPDTGKVQEEIKNPGTHHNPKNWVNPAKRQRDDRVGKEWRKRVLDFNEIDPETFLDGPADPRESWNDPGLAPEPIEELLALPGMTIDQVARMKGIDSEEVRRIAVECKIPIDASVVGEIVNASRREQVDRAHDKIEAAGQVASAQVDTYPGLESLDERIWSMSDDGRNPGAISAALRMNQVTMTYAEVLEVVKRKPV